ncbi:hypothetical protein QBC43DRAFT_307217 [Cladorrhinum sp. PSN259]|nr:hypothetical protein QBC43DRAFT_307217 [Cladorrhinum sp. PSN259]
MAAPQVSAASATGDIGGGAGGGGGVDVDVLDGASSSSIPVAAPDSSDSAPGPTSSPPAADPEPSNDDEDDKAADEAAPVNSIPIRDKESYMKLVVDRFQTRDWIHSALLSESQIQLEKHTRDALAYVSDYRGYKEFYANYPARLYGEGYRGFGNSYTENGTTTKLIYPSQRPRPGKRTTPPIRFTKKEMKKQAEIREELVPIRIDVDWDKIKLRDTFTCNLHDRLIKPELIAAQLVEDMGLKPPLAQPVYEQVAQQINEQLNEYEPLVFYEQEALDPELPYLAYKNDEMRILVKLNITIGAHTLIDQFEWEINNPQNSPEEFAACMARDLSLSGEFTTAIAHCIREQAQLFTRSLYSIGHVPDGRPIEDADLVAAFLPSPLPSVFRPQQQAKDYAPYLYENTETELERTETMLSREQRRQKRSINRRGGPSLPDLKERQRTIRTSIVSSVLPGAALNIEESRLFKRATGAGAGRGKRAAGRDGDLSDSEDSDDSAPESPAVVSQLQQGTARTRGMRGAATAAAQRMANLGRSETPEAIIHHHETRTSRRFGGREATAREETEEPHQYIVTLRLNPARLRKFMREYRARPAGSASATPTMSRSAAPMGPPPPHTPASASSSATPRPATGGPAPVPSGLAGKVPAPPPGSGNNQPAPPPPEWLEKALDELRKSYPNDRYEAWMRTVAVNNETGQQELGPVAPGRQREFSWFYVPRIKCLDCPGKSYTAGPDLSVQNFEVHVRNQKHQKQVAARVNAAAAGSGSIAAAGTS